MGISIDTVKVEDLRKLSAFFEFISNPQSYKDFVKETSATLGKMEKVVAAYTTVEEANVYAAKIQAKIGETNEFVAKEQKKLQEHKDAEMARIAVREVAVAAREAKVQQGEQALLAAERVARNQEMQLTKRAADLQLAEQRVANAQAQVDAQVADLAARAAKVRELVGA